MNKKIIAFSGAHGTGKTTSVYGLAERLKLKGIANGNIGVILETARKCPLPIFTKNTIPTEDAQWWIFGRQVVEESEACHQYDLVVSDRSLVDCIAYCKLFGYVQMSKYLEITVQKTMNRYHSIIFKRIRNNDYLTDDGLRSIDVHLRERYETILLGMYERMEIPVIYSADDLML